MGTEVMIEEAFMDVSCDLVYGGHHFRLCTCHARATVSITLGPLIT